MGYGKSKLNMEALHWANCEKIIEFEEIMTGKSFCEDSTPSLKRMMRSSSRDSVGSSHNNYHRNNKTYFLRKTIQKSVPMEKDLNEKGKEIWQPELQEEDMMESLEVAFSRRWNQPKQSKEINLGGITDIDEEKWKRTLIGKLHVRRQFDDDDLTKELIRNWNIRGKFDLVKVADGIVSITFDISYTMVSNN
ncbi:hypothetical protein FRX31_010764 [Thalictrum thalictroides]|uniref:Uncharacterized protein n=1 Tax=Thalictrum thalictroides TaxID=46969 RepID=A0A7J6WQK7_THATH|nr:hypothetical protein FRX31_010764 [Thalictrum thalictroides]